VNTITRTFASALVVATALVASDALAAPPSNGSAQPLDPTLTGVAAAALDNTARTMAPGMNREGSPMAATFDTGQTMEEVIPLQTGRCYTVVAAGPGVQAWDFQMQLVTGPVPVVPVLAHEAATGTQASLGAGNNCFRWSWLPAQARVVVRVTQGSGVAVAQVYAK